MSNLHMFSCIYFLHIFRLILGGPRICLGRECFFIKERELIFSLALLELRYIIAGLLFKFKIEIPGETNSDSMSEVEFGAPRPKSGKMKLRFTARH